MSKLVYIIILNWNGFNDTIECVESCLKLDYHSYEIVLVDNCSSDGSEAILRKRFPKLTFIQTGANLGYAGGNNVGIRYALEKNADYFWLLNNDTVVDSKALTELVEILEMEPANGMAGSKILSYSQPSLIYYAGGWVDPNLGASGHVGMGQKDDHQFDVLMETGYITGCSLLVKRTVVEEIGFMDEAYFLYCEESEWCLNARRKGYRLMYVPRSVIFHKESVSTKKIKGAMTYYMTRNRLYFISKNGTDVEWLNRFRTDLCNLLRYMYKKQFVAARSMVAAYWHWVNGYMGRRDCPIKINKI